MCFYSVFSDIGNLIYDIWGVTIDTKQKDGDKMKWHKINKCLPPEGEVVLVHVNDYKYMVGQLSSYGMNVLRGLSLRKKIEARSSQRYKIKRRR